MTGSGAHRKAGAERTPAWRAGLTRSADTIDVTTWAGSVPAAGGVAPRVRFGSKWFNLLWLLPIGLVLLVAAVAVAKGLREIPAVEAFVDRYPGMVAGSPDTVGIPVWARWQHFFNLFLMMFILRSGLQILSDHPRLYWTRHCTPGREWFRIQKPVPADPLWTAKQDSISIPRHVGLPGLRHSIGLARWWHLGVDTLWLLNGVVFYVLLFSTPHWHRLVPTSVDVFPQAGSVALQYLSLNWPQDNGWIAYNGLQLIAYFITVFLAAPLALFAGLGMSPALSNRITPISKVLNIQVARSLHFLVWVWFVFFITVHVALVVTTGILGNLNHITTGRTDGSWLGFGLFAVWMAVVVVAWVAASPFTIRHPRWVQQAGSFFLGPVEKWFEHVDPRAGQYTEKDVSPYFWHNGRYPDSADYQRLADGDFVDWRLRIEGTVENPVTLSLSELQDLPQHEQITQHYCIQGWSGVARWTGVSMTTVLDLVQPTAEARWVIFYSLGEGADGGTYYDAHSIEHMYHRLTMLAYEMNGEPLSFGHGAPLRLRNEAELGFKQVKWLTGIEFVADYREVGSGYGGYNEDHEFFGYRQAI